MKLNVLSVLALAGWLAAAGCVHPGGGRGGVRVEPVEFRGWTNAWRLSNAACELVVVPDITHIMWFSLKGGSNLLWVSDEAHGGVVQEPAVRWHNFGGDKVWPTDESNWRPVMKRRWPPSYEFDGGCGSAQPVPGGLRLESPEDPAFGAVCVREFVMDPVNPLVVMRQWFEKRHGEAVPMMFWTISQVRPAAANILPLSERSGSNSGYCVLGVLSNVASAVEGDWLKLVNHGSFCQKAGVGWRQAGDNGWVASLFRDEEVLLVQSHARVPGAVYPDQGCQAEIFTGSQEFSLYTELELMGPMMRLAAGERLSHDVVWQLVPIKGREPLSLAGAGQLAQQAHGRALDALARRLRSR